MGYIKSRVNGTVQGMYCDICGKEYVRVVSNPNNSSQDMCVKCYNDFYNGGQQKDQQIAELKAENLSLQEQSIRDNQNYNEELANLQQQIKDNTKQVCEKIRKWGNKHFNWVGDGTGYDGQDYNEMIGFNNAITKLLEFLDQIEKGENNEN